MKRTGRKREWSLTLFCVGVLLLFPPILGIINQPTLVFGVPVAFLFLFGLWAMIILLIAIGARRRQLWGDEPGGKEGDDPKEMQIRMPMP